MKHSFLFFLLIFGFNTLAAGQNIWISAGGNLSNISESPNQNIEGTHLLKLGFHAGAIYEQKILSFLSIEGGLMINSCGERIKVENPDKTLSLYQSRTRILYLDFPVGIKLQYPILGREYFVSAGGYFAYGLSGQVTGKRIFDGTESALANTFSWAENPSDAGIPRTDCGLTFGLGTKISTRIIGGIYYDHGLSNLAGESALTSAHRVIRLSFGYWFF